MPKLAAFPKAYIRALVQGGMNLREWVDLAAPLGLDGLEFYSGFHELADPKRWPELRRTVESAGMTIPMMCCSPDFSQPDPTLRRQEIEKEKQWIRMSAELGAKYCRVLSGQRRPQLTQDQGLQIVVENIEACLPEAEKCGVTLIIENHYKDDFWEYPEFAQKMDVFLEIVDAIDDRTHFGVQYDPSNAIVAGDDPIELLERVKDRVVTMHASDRYLEPGTTLDELRQTDGTIGYFAKLKHGVTGKGLNDYDRIFAILKSANYQGWISIEDGMNGMAEMKESIDFLKRMRDRYFS